MKKITAKQYLLKHARLLIPPFLLLVCGSILLQILVNHLQEEDLRKLRYLSRVNAIAYSNRITQDIRSGIQITNCMEEIIINGDGQFSKFQEIAPDLMKDTIQSIQLAPAGKVTDIYPEEENDAGKIDLLHDKARSSYANYAKEHEMTVLQGRLI